MTIRILNGDSRAVVRTLADKSVHACVCSPPYFRLRDYQMPGQIGLERSPEAYIAELVDLFREIRRVLRDDGSLWINIGDCYAGSGRGGNPAAASSTLLGSLQSQEASMVVRQNWEVGAISRAAANTERGSRLPAGMHEEARLAGAVGRAWEAPPLGYKEKDLLGIPWKLAEALRAPEYRGGIHRERDRVWLAAIIDGEGSISGFEHTRTDDGSERTGLNICVTNTSQELLSECCRIWPASTRNHVPAGAGHLGVRRVDRWIPSGAGKKAQLIEDVYPYLIAKREQALVAWNLAQAILRGKVDGHSPNAEEARAKRKRMVGLLRALNAGQKVDLPNWLKPVPTLYRPGWYLRKDNIWAKPNGMPESTRDRSTSAHEYVFHLTKSERYYFGYEDVRLPPAPDSVTRLARAMRSRLGAEDEQLVLSGGGYAPAGQPPHAGARKRDRQRGHGRRHAGFNDRWDAMPVAEQHANGAALRSVWWVAPGGFNDEFCLRCRRFFTHSQVGGLRTEKIERDGRRTTLRFCECGHHDGWLKHFAVMPAEIAAACVLAGVPKGGTVLDPFAGAGTTGLVADRLQRDAVLIELNPDYAEMAARRIRASSPMLANVDLEQVPA